MTQAVSEKSDQAGGAAQQNKVLAQQLEMKSQELRSAKMERDEIQKQLDALQSQGSYYQDKYREATEELRTLRQEHSVASATSAKLKMRVESLQKEAEDLRSHCAKLGYENRANVGDND